MAKLAPSILSADLANLEKQVKLIQKGGADYVHYDVIDGQFAPNITFGAPLLKCLAAKTDMPFDVHLMIETPELRIEDFCFPNTEYIVVHQEACKHLHRVIQQIKALGKKAGVALNPATPVSAIMPVLGDLDLVLVMSVNPGFSGQKFIPSSVLKVCELDEIRKKEELGYVIEVDGGVNLENCVMLKDAGADILVAGNACFGAEDVTKRCREFKKLLK
ncbi:MAG: ribulose-phosphate 3-epimerase [Firmicutes bacterium]|nr:ribulose-phosphate 3-epimerase [Bacillota bacterium]MBR6025696.1 ribulose-phosphate 3-epimerase [Bacillota bacterium]